jgi:glucose/arabinose dehydrogenase
MRKRGCWLELVTFVLAACALGCGKSSAPAPGNPGNSAPITGTERLAWNQPAENASELASFTYVLYVDGVRSDAIGASCDPTGTSAGFACRARLPALTPGLHTLELATVITTDAGSAESPRSAPLTVNVASAAAIGVRPAAFPEGMAITTSDGVSLTLTLVADGVSDVTDLAAAADGRVFVADRAGHVRVVRDGHLVAQPALTLADNSTVLALALAPDFVRTHLIYAVGTVHADGAPPAFWLARFREVGDRLGERAVLLSSILAAAMPSASLRIGPDGKLYPALDDGGDPNLANDLGSISGKILRLNLDGATPSDQAMGSPVYLSGLHSPRGLDWDPRSGLMWAADAASSAAVLTVVGPGEDRARRGVPRRTYALTPTTIPASVTFYRSNAIPQFQGNLFVTSIEGRHLLRAQINAADPATIERTELLLTNQVGGIHAVAEGADGALYFATDTAIAKLIDAGHTIQTARPRGEQ